MFHMLIDIEAFKNRLYLDTGVLTLQCEFSSEYITKEIIRKDFL